jgi:CDP-diacylglycerol--glycerol-3-phosphate 3-phosphatidyltransferase
MTIYDLKSRFQDTLRSFCRHLATNNVTANQVTITALLLSLLGGYFVYAGSTRHILLIAVPAILFLRMALNALDGCTPSALVGHNWPIA